MKSFLTLASVQRYVSFLSKGHGESHHRSCLLRNTRIFLYSSRLEITPAGPSQLKAKPAISELGFGKVFSDHMLKCTWKQGQGWDAPRIEPVKPFQMHPAAKVRIRSRLQLSSWLPRFRCCTTLRSSLRE